VSLVQIWTDARVQSLCVATSKNRARVKLA
jgi:hypothetical protein